MSWWTHLRVVGALSVLRKGHAAAVEIKAAVGVLAQSRSSGRTCGAAVFKSVGVLAVLTTGILLLAA